MQRYQIHNLLEWSRVKSDEAILFPAGSNGRTIKFDVNTTGKVNVWANDTGDKRDTPALVASASGLFRCEVATRGPLHIWFTAEKGEFVFYQSRVSDQTVVTPEGQEKYTNIDPRPEMSPQFRQMMVQTKLNKMRRDEDMAEERALHAERVAQLKAMQPKPDTEKPVPEPEQTVSEKPVEKPESKD